MSAPERRGRARPGSSWRYPTLSAGTRLARRCCRRSACRVAPAPMRARGRAIPEQASPVGRRLTSWEEQGRGANGSGGQRPRRRLRRRGFDCRGRAAAVDARCRAPRPLPFGQPAQEFGSSPAAARRTAHQSFLRGEPGPENSFSIVCLSLDRIEVGTCSRAKRALDEHGNRSKSCSRRQLPNGWDSPPWSAEDHTIRDLVLRDSYAFISVC